MLEDKKQEQIAGIISDYFDGTVAEADIDILAIKIYENAFNDTKWQKLKEYLKNQIADLRHIDVKTETQSLRINDSVNCFRQVMHKMQELEVEDEN